MMVPGESERDRDSAPNSITALFALGVATSVDALAAGTTLQVFPVPVGVSVVLIGALTFALAAAAGLAGRALGPRFGIAAQRTGGAVLLVLAIVASRGAFS